MNWENGRGGAEKKGLELGQYEKEGVVGGGSSSGENLNINLQLLQECQTRSHNE